MWLVFSLVPFALSPPSCLFSQSPSQAPPTHSSFLFRKGSTWVLKDLLPSALLQGHIQQANPWLEEGTEWPRSNDEDGELHASGLRYFSLVYALEFLFSPMHWKSHSQDTPLPSQGLRLQSYSTRWSRFCNTVWELFFLSSSLTACLWYPRYSARLYHITQWEHSHRCPQLPGSSFRHGQNRNKMPGLHIPGHTSSLPWP